jgi:hypothetical protein
MNNKAEKLKTVIEKIIKNNLSKNEKMSLQETPSNSRFNKLILNEFDDLLVQIEMLIDDSYGEVELDEFKKSFNKLSEFFEKRLYSILNNHK